MKYEKLGQHVKELLGASQPQKRPTFEQYFKAGQILVRSPLFKEISKIIDEAIIGANIDI